MGAGKTVVGRALAERLGCLFCDLDQAVETLTGRSIPDIFAAEGEAGFRQWEYKALQVLPDSAVVALGGGAFVQDAVRLALPRLGKSAYLAWPFPVLWSRIAGDKARPLVADQHRTEALFRAREPIYRLADIVWEPPEEAVPGPQQIAADLARMVTAS